MSDTEKKEAREANRVLKFLTRWSLVVAELYPILFTVMVCWKRFTDNFSNFFDVLISLKWSNFNNYDPDWIVGIIGSLVIVTGIILLINKEVQKRKGRKELRNIVSGAPSTTVLKSPERLFNRVHILTKGFAEVEAALDGGDYTKTSELEALFSSIASIIRNVAAEYFKIPIDDINVNFMIHLKLNVGENDLYKKFQNNYPVEDIYTRNEVVEDNCLGGLYLMKSLYFGNSESFNNNIVIPLYQPTAHTYNAPEVNDDLAIPGAPAAFYSGFHVIENTRNPENYKGFNERTKKDIEKYFLTKAKNIRSIISISIPNDQNKSVGVLNIDSKRASAFSFDETDYSIFYTFIYPTLKLTEKYVVFYGKCLISKLE